MSRLSTLLRFALIVVFIGVVVGILGILLGYTLSVAEHLAFGYSIDSIHSHESYLDAIRAASPLRKVLALSICGVIGGLGWFLLYRYGKKLVGLKQAVNSEKLFMPATETVVNALLQVVTIGMGSPLGKEAAPREIGALLASRVSGWCKLDRRDARLLMAAAAGGGLAAVYNVPIAGALFALEVLMQGARLKWIVVAFAISFISAITARFGLGDVHQYTVHPALHFNGDVFVWALVTAPLFAFAAQLFIDLTDDARARAPKKGLLVFFNILNFTILGVLLIFLPELAGNGRSAAQISFTGQITLFHAAILLVTKILVEWGSLRAGAQGGLLTPGLANGALMAVILGSFWTRFFPGTAPGAFAIIGAATFLGIANNIPVTAIVIVLEMTQVDWPFLAPMVVCMGAAQLTQFMWKRYRNRL